MSIDKTLSAKSTLAISRTFLFVLVCFSLSGVTGLIYQILWTRMIVRIIGTAPFAISIILTIFMAGLGLGSYLASRKIDSIIESPKLLRIYGILELIIGGYGLVLPLLLGLMSPLFSALYNGVFETFMLYNLLTFVGCSVLLIVPVTCMGATLPILCRFYVNTMSHLGTHSGRLYGLNTIGAAIGALLTGFWLLHLLGIWGTLVVAVTINASIGLACIAAAGKLIRSRKTSADPTPAQRPVEEPCPYSTVTVKTSLLVFAISGFCAMAYEVIWTKLIALLAGPTTYSFTIVLVTFIMGLALGSMFFGWLGDRTRRPVELLIVTQIVAAALALGASQLLGSSQLFFAKLLATYQDSFGLQGVMKAGFLFAVMLVPTLCLGATFPLVGKIFTPSTARIGRSIGVAYAINTIGAVLGSFLAGFVIIPVVGKALGLSLVVGLQVAGALVLAAVLVVSSRPRKSMWVPIVATGVMVLVGCVSLPRWNQDLLAQGMYHRFQGVGLNLKSIGWFQSIFEGPELIRGIERPEVVFHSDGVAGLTVVLKDTDALGNDVWAIANSGKPEASSLGDMSTQTLMAHFGMIFHPNPRTVMVLGLASGITAGEALYYPVERLDVVEISSEVVKACEFFDPWNNHVLEDERTNLIVQDGRAHLAMFDGMYDMVSSEPSNPWMAGLAALFTEEFFGQVRDHLNGGGVFVQFLHSYQMDWETFSMVGRTFAKVFPSSMLVATGSSAASLDFLLVGFKGDSQIDLEVARANTIYTQRSPNVDLRDPRIYYNFIMTEDLASLFDDGPINSDYMPRLEFMAPKTMFQLDPDATIGRRIQERAKFTKATAEVREDLKTNPGLQLDLVAYMLSVNMPVVSSIPDLFEWESATMEQQAEYRQMIEQYCSSVQVSPRAFQDERAQAYARAGLKRGLEAAVAEGRAPRKGYAILGRYWMVDGQADEAAAVYARWLEREADDTQMLTLLGEALVGTEAYDEALKHLEKAILLDPNNFLAYYQMGVAVGKMGQYAQAIDYFQGALQLSPSYIEARFALAMALASTGRLREAQDQVLTVLRADPNHQAAQIALQKLQSMGIK